MKARGDEFSLCAMGGRKVELLGGAGIELACYRVVVERACGLEGNDGGGGARTVTIFDWGLH
jgi:hypothetical protein